MNTATSVARLTANSIRTAFPLRTAVGFAVNRGGLSVGFCVVRSSAASRNVEFMGNPRYARHPLRRLIRGGGSKVSEFARHRARLAVTVRARMDLRFTPLASRSEEHTSELQSQSNLVCR